MGRKGEGRNAGGLLKESPRPPRTFLEFLLTEPRLVPVSEKTAGCGGHGKCRPDSAPAVAPTPQVQPVPLPVSARGCKGRSPLHEITLILPLPAGKSALRARAGGWGLQSKLKAGLAGDQKGKPPQQIPERQRQPATCRASTPTGTYTAGSARAASGSGAGMQGAEPLA